MGCDIHLVLEKKHGDKWVGIDTFNGHHVGPWRVKEGEHDWYSPVTRSRNYERFAKLAGVRGDGPEAKGLPEDASDTARLLSEEWGSDGHSHSWLPLAEASNIFCQTDQKPTDQAEKYPTSYFFGVDVSDGSDEQISKYRVVFWFDN